MSKKDLGLCSDLDVSRDDISDWMNSQRAQKDKRYCS